MTGIASGLIPFQLVIIYRFDEFLVMTTYALDLRVPAHEQESGAGIVVELRLFFRKACQTVTGNTGRSKWRVVISLMGIAVTGVAIRESESLQNR